VTARRSLEWSDGAVGPLLAAEDVLTWQDSALCAQVDRAVFFPSNGYVADDARRICAACPVRPQCLDYALALEYAPDQNGVQGIWAGLDEDERAGVRAARGLPEPVRPKPDTVIPALKRCAGPCGQRLVLAEFHRKLSERDGRDSRCRECVAAATADRKARAAA
jgi:hypothetical protein